MKKLREMKISPKELEAGLRENALRHKNYNMYTAMDRAMCLALTGNLYISNGQAWNDIVDREIMQRRSAFGICMSCSTIESMAMWMLYSGDKGKNGALVQFTPSIIKEIVELPTVELGKFDPCGKFSKNPLVLTRKDKNFDIFMTDVIYTDTQEKDPSKLIASLGEDHEHLDQQLLESAGVFFKHYAWSYEKECRLIIKLSPEMQQKAIKNDFDTIRISLSVSAQRAIRKRIVRSPVYAGKTDFGQVSTLFGNVDWNL